ncbi:MAG: DNA cytosine methyltransferase [Pigmentiphaga sp.]
MIEKLGISLLATDTDAVAPVVVDLFCGAGGLAYGLKAAGLKVVAGIDLDPSCKFPLEKNTGATFVEKDVKELSPEELRTWFGEASVRILAGCAPCQPFSTYSQGRKSKDDRWTLLREFKRLAVATLPEIVTMENVPGLASQSVWEEFISALRAAGYNVCWQKVDCSAYEIPQRRRRLVLLASRLGSIELIPAQKGTAKTVAETIGNLPAIKAGEACPDDPLHAAASLSPKNVRRMKASKPGGTWRDWPKALRAKCHVKKSGKTYPSVYGRMEWNKPSPTMTTQCYGFGNGRFGHPEQDRAISLREAALLQSFPPDYAFLEEKEAVSFSRLGILIGNAVPPKLGEVIGRSIFIHLEQVRSGEVPKGQLSLL